MAIRESSLMEAPLSALAADIHTDPSARAAWLEVAAARLAAQLMRNARARQGLSQAAVARLLGVSQARISQVESGRVEDVASLEFLTRFIDACGDELVLSTRAAERPQAGAPASPPRPAGAGTFEEAVEMPAAEPGEAV